MPIINIGKVIILVHEIVASLSSAMGIMAMNYSQTYKSLLDMNNIEATGTDILFAKLVRYSSNIFCISHMYPEEIKEGLLSHDLNQLLYFLIVLLKTYNLDTESITKDQNLALEVGGIYLNRLGYPIMITRFRGSDANYPFQDEYGRTYIADGSYTITATAPHDLISKV